MYVKDIEHGTTSVTSQPEIMKQTEATAWVDGHHCLGAVVGNFCMDLAIEKAKKIGVGWVSAKGIIALSYRSNSLDLFHA